MSFLAVKSYSWAVSSPWLGIPGLMLICSVINLIAFAILLVFQPETRGLTITELATLFDDRVKKKEENEDGEVRQAFVEA